jgi:hypothetical protein
MHRVLGILAATATLGATGAASADEITGPIHNIDLIRQTFSIGGEVFTAAASNMVGAKLADLKPGAIGSGCSTRPTRASTSLGTRWC